MKAADTCRFRLCRLILPNQFLILHHYIRIAIRTEHLRSVGNQSTVTAFAGYVIPPIENCRSISRADISHSVFFHRGCEEVRSPWRRRGKVWPSSPWLIVREPKVQIIPRGRTIPVCIRGRRLECGS